MLTPYLILTYYVVSTLTFAGLGSKRQTTIDFNAAQQLIDVSGAHAFHPPGPSDLRGPCPGLNALANHRYIAGNGYTTLQESASASTAVFGLGVDLALVLATLGAVEAGDGNHFSIGGPPSQSLPILGGLLGQPLGISESHNRFEGDGSPMKGDLYQYGEAYLTQLSNFQELYDLPGSIATNPDPNFDIPVLGDFAALRYQECVSQNPYYFRGPIGFIVPPGTHAFIFRLMSNKSAAYPEGYLDRDNLKSFYAISGEEPNLFYTPGHERIPENWYTRAKADPYDSPLFVNDLVTFAAVHPDLLNFGGNTGTVNSFTGLNVTNLTGGLYNAETLLQGNNLGCFLFQTTALATPDLLRNAGIISDIVGATNQVNNAINGALSGLGCPQLSSYNYNGAALGQYPGYTRLKKDGTY